MQLIGILGYNLVMVVWGRFFYYTVEKNLITLNKNTLRGFSSKISKINE